MQVKVYSACASSGLPRIQTDNVLSAKGSSRTPPALPPPHRLTGVALHLVAGDAGQEGVLPLNTGAQVRKLRMPSTATGGVKALSPPRPRPPAMAFKAVEKQRRAGGLVRPAAVASIALRTGTRGRLRRQRRRRLRGVVSGTESDRPDRHGEENAAGQSLGGRGG